MAVSDWPDWSGHVTTGAIDIGTVTGPVNVQNVEGGVVRTGEQAVKVGTVTTLTITVGRSSVSTVVHTVPPGSGAIALQIGGKLRQHIVTVSVVATGGSDKATIPYSAGCRPGGTETGGTVIVLPVAQAPATGTVTVTLYRIGTTSDAVSGFITIWALSGAPPLSVRSDGRVFPLGTNIAIGTVENTTTTLVTGLASDQRILLAGLTLVTGTATGYVSGHIGGSEVRLVRSLGKPGVYPMPVWPGGLLLDAGQGISLTAATPAEKALAIVYYDLVV